MSAGAVARLIIGAGLLLMLACSSYRWAVEELAQRWERLYRTGKRLGMPPWYVHSYRRDRARLLRRIGRHQ